MVVTPSVTTTAIMLGALGVSSNIVISSSIGDTVTVGVSYIAFGMFMCLLRIVIDDTRMRGGMRFLFNLILGGFITFIFGFGLYSVGAPIEYHLSLALIAVFIGDDLLMNLIHNGQSYIHRAIRGSKQFVKELIADLKDIFS